MEGGLIDAGLGDESMLGDGESFYLHILEDMTDRWQKGDLDDLMAGLSGRTQESHQPAAETESTGVDAPVELPDDVNGGPNDEEVIPSLAGDSHSSQATSTDFASLMAVLAGDMDVDDSVSLRTRPRMPTNYSALLVLGLVFSVKMLTRHY